MKPSSFWSKLCIPAITAVAFALRLHRLDYPSLWFDEGITLWKIQQPLLSIFLLGRSDTVPPLYYCLLKGWVMIFGRSDMVVRLFSVVIGTANIPLVYFLARRLLGVRVGIAAALVLTFSSFHIQYSQEARSYALTLLLFTLGLYSLVLLHDNSSRLNWAGYSLCAVLMLYSHGLSFLYLASLNLFFLASRNTRQMSVVRPWVVSNLIVTACFLPWLTIYVMQIDSFRRQTQLPFPGFGDVATALASLASFPAIYSLPPMWSEVRNWLPVFHLPWLISLSFLTAISLLTAFWKHDSHLWRQWLLFLAPIMFVFAVSLAASPIFLTRVLIVCLIPMSIILGASQGSSSVKTKTLRCAFLLTFLACSFGSGVLYYLKDWKADYRAASEYLVHSAGSNDVVIFVSNVGEILFDWYCDGRRQDLRKTGLPIGIYDRGEPDSMQVVRSVQDIEGLSKIVKGGHQFWLFRNHTFIHDPGNICELWMDRHLTRARTVDFNRIQLICYRIEVSQQP